MQLTLEIHESAVTDLSEMRQIRSELTRIDISLAFDDFGAGQARLVELVEVRPDYLKFDMKLIRGIDQASAQRQQMLASLVKMASELGSAPLGRRRRDRGRASRLPGDGLSARSGLISTAAPPPAARTRSNKTRPLDAQSSSDSSRKAIRHKSTQPVIAANRKNSRAISG